MPDWRLGVGLLSVILAGVVIRSPDRVPGVSAQPTHNGETGRRDMSVISASMADDNDALARLLRDGADPNIVDASGLTPLMWAAICQNEANIKALLDAGADPCAQDMEGHTALWHSTRRTLNYTWPLRRGMHGTIFLRRIIPTPAMRLLAAASRHCTGP